MQVRELEGEYERYQGLELVDQDDADLLLNFLGGVEPLGSRWKPLRIQVSEETEEAFPTDFTFLQCCSRAPVFSGRAVEALRDLLEANGELLPLKCKTGEYWILNAIRVLDCLDAKGSEFDCFDDGVVSEIIKFAFFPERIGDVPIFRLQRILPDGDKSAWVEIFVTDRFMDRVKQEKLVGFDCPLLWTDAPQPKKAKPKTSRSPRKKK